MGMPGNGGGKASVPLPTGAPVATGANAEVELDIAELWDSRCEQETGGVPGRDRGIWVPGPHL